MNYERKNWFRRKKAYEYSICDNDVITFTITCFNKLKWHILHLDVLKFLTPTWELAILKFVFTKVIDLL